MNVLAPVSQPHLSNSDHIVCFLLVAMILFVSSFSERESLSLYFVRICLCFLSGSRKIFCQIHNGFGIEGVQGAVFKVIKNSLYPQLPVKIDHRIQTHGKHSTTESLIWY